MAVAITKSEKLPKLLYSCVFRCLESDLTPDLLTKFTEIFARINVCMALEVLHPEGNMNSRQVMGCCMQCALTEGPLCCEYQSPFQGPFSCPCHFVSK